MNKHLENYLAELETLDDDELMTALNDARQLLATASPYQDHPTDCTLWVPARKVVSNDYNPNRVARPEMKLLLDSIHADGVTMNMVTPIELVQRVVDGMGERGFGRIVNITSSSVLAPIAGLDLSSGARAGLTAFLAGVARTVADRGVTINQIMPGAFDTERLRGNLANGAARSGKGVEEVASARRASIPAGRFGTPGEFGAACAFLCSERAGYITGQNLLIDGGAFASAF